MKEPLKSIVDAFHKYNSEHMAEQTFALSSDEQYDLLVVAPSFTPFKLHMDEYCKVTTLAERSYLSSFLVEKDGLRIAWVKIAASAGNLIDHLAICTELTFKRMVFIGAVGALKADWKLGDVATPSYSVSGSMADTYLMRESIRDSMLFTKVTPDQAFADHVIEIARGKCYEIRKGSVFCTPTIAAEYIHLDEIREWGTDLIEMETASFILMTDLMEILGIALLVVSDNSANGTPLVGRTEEQQKQYVYGRDVVLPDMILTLAAE